jgi:hypothetical protein
MPTGSTPPTPVATSTPAATPEPRPPLRPVPVPFPLGFVITGFLLLLTAEVATEAWYRHHETQLPAPKEWAVDWPRDARDFKMGEFPERTRAILKYNFGETATWTTPEGHTFQMYYIRWYPGRVSKFLSGAHYPTVCLPATGLQLRAETGLFRSTTPALEVPFASFLFDSAGRPVYVYHSIIEDVTVPDGGKIDYRQVASEERIDSVLRGHRNLGQRVIGISLLGPVARDEAEAIVQRTLSSIIRPLNPTQTANR